MEEVTRAHEEDQRAMREQALFLETRIEAGSTRLRRRLSSLDVRTRLTLGGVVAGAALIVMSATVFEVGAVGSGYFLRLGVLLVGIGLVQLLRR